MAAYEICEMNKKRKILTLVAMAVFGVIIALHYVPDPTANSIYYTFIIADVRMPLFVWPLFYAGLFAILGDNKRKEQ